MSWYALYVKSRNEKKVSELLQNKGYEVYSPLKEEWRQWSDRRKKVLVPYFTSYVFINLNIKDKIDILSTPGVVNFVYWNGQPAIISDQEMMDVMAFFHTHSSAEISIEKRYEIGSEVKLTKGVFDNFKGVVLAQSKNKITLELKHLNIRLVVEKEKLEFN